jgi:uncharacterized protein (DUF1800 family)
MGDQNTVLDDAAARHLVRRSGFGARPSEIATFSGLTRGAAADTLLSYRARGFKPNGANIDKARGKWVKYMAKSRAPLSEKLVLFWHDHFATGYSKVRNLELMGIQNKTLRLLGNGDMRVLVKAMNKDAAMIEWLDTVRNHKDVPNENYGRELQELFTLGVEDLRGNPNYTQDDVKTIARAFTGWSYDGHGNPIFDPGDHDFESDFPERGPKVIYQSTGGFGAGGAAFDAPEGATEIDQVIDVIFQHRDTDGKNTVARRTTKRLLEFFCHGGWAAPSNAQIQIIDDLVTTSGFDTSFDVGALLRAIFTHDAFYETQPPPSASTPKSVKWPVDFVVSTLRMTGVVLKGVDQFLEGGDYLAIAFHLSNMGQDLLDPPSVFGWDWELSWISSATLLARYHFARDLMMAREGGGRFKPEQVLDLSLTAAPDIVDAVLTLLGVDDQLSAAEQSVLVNYLGGPSATLDLQNDVDLRNEKLNGLIALVLESPHYQVH